MPLRGRASPGCPGRGLIDAGGAARHTSFVDETIGAAPGGGFRPVTEAIISELAELCGAANVASDAKALARYSRDQVPEERYAHAPDVVVKPASTGEVA